MSWATTQFERHAHGGPTMLDIAELQRLMRRSIGCATSLVVHREGDRNRVLLRFLLPGGTQDVEVRWLLALRRERLAPAILKERIFAKMGYVREVAPVCG